jgi:hypothetical protein
MPTSFEDVLTLPRFVYGGVETTAETDGQVFSYPDAWILTIPGFNWFPAEASGINSPGSRSFHTCELIGQRQVLMYGGFNYRNGSGDFREVDPMTQGIGVFDMTSLTWKDSYDPVAPAYEQPQAVADWYSSRNLDSVDWVSDELRTMIENGDTIWSANHTSSNPTVLIISCAVGGTVGLALIFLLAWSIVRTWRGLPIFGRRKPEEPIYERPSPPVITRPVVASIHREPELEDPPISYGSPPTSYDSPSTCYESPPVSYELDGSNPSQLDPMNERVQSISKYYLPSSRKYS